MTIPLYELQEKLGYKFQNIQLLHEALTYDIDPKNPEWDIFEDENVFYPKRKLHRLKCVGVSVLKLLTAEKAIIVNAITKENPFSDEGVLTGICQAFNEECDFVRVVYNLNLLDYILCTNGSNFTNPSIFKDILQAIFGAVFIDGGGCESKNDYALQSVRELFDLIINKYDLCCYTFPDSQEVYKCFVTNHHFVREYLLSKNYAEEIKPYEKLEKKISYRFQDPDLLKTALTHDSVKGLISDVSHYEVLEFLGDAVYELVICEYLFWHYINDWDGKVFNFGTITKFVSKKFQQVISNGLNLQKFIIKPDHVTVNDIHDFLESIVGAIYIDSESLKPVKTVLIELCRRFEIETATNCNLRLPFALRTYYGSKYHVPYEKLGMIKDDHELPPERQDIFRIVDFYKLKLLLGNLHESNKVGKGVNSYDGHAKVLGSESFCNQLEFGRVGLFPTMSRIQHFLQDTGGMSCKYHTYDSLDTDNLQETLETSVPPVYYLTQECNCSDDETNRQPKFKDVRKAFITIITWIQNLMIVFLRGLGEFSFGVIKIIILLINFFIFFTICEFFFGNVAMIFEYTLD